MSKETKLWYIDKKITRIYRTFIEADSPQQALDKAKKEDDVLEWAWGRWSDEEWINVDDVSEVDGKW